MYQAVVPLVATVYLVGMALGLRFRVVVLIPAGIAVLVLSALVQLLWPGVAVWGLAGTLASLVVINLGFAFGLLLRVGAAFLSTRKTGRLFARPVHVDQSTHRPEEAGSEGASRVGSLKAAPTMARRELAGKGVHQ